MAGVLQQFGGVDPVGFGPGPIQGEGGLVVAIEAVAVENQGLGLGVFGCGLSLHMVVGF